MRQYMTTKTLPKGIYIQIYRGVIPGRSPNEQTKNLTDKLDLFKSIGVTGIIMHGFTAELNVNKFGPLAKLCKDRDLICLAAYGLDSADPLGKAQRMAPVANHPDCQALVLDMEGAWEDEASDKQAAVVMGQELKKLSPDSLIIDQPWPVPTLHGSFPWEETAAYVDIRAAQWYCNDFISSFGDDRYKRCWKWFSDSWKVLDFRLGKKGLVKPEIKTVQGYKWILKDLINCLTTEETIFVWCEPYPDAVFMQGLVAVNKLKQLGFTGPDAVKNFQLSTNGKLIADNICGPLTIKELGL